MKHTKVNALLVLTLLCINSIAAVGLIQIDSKDLNHGYSLKSESIAQKVEEVRGFDIHDLNLEKYTGNNPDNTPPECDNTDYNMGDTFSVTGYPSSYLNPKPYRMVKVTFKRTLLEVASINPKNVPESEITFDDDSDWDICGYIKDSRGSKYDLNDYILKIEECI